MATVIVTKPSGPPVTEKFASSEMSFEAGGVLLVTSTYTGALKTVAFAPGQWTKAEEVTS